MMLYVPAPAELSVCLSIQLDFSTQAHNNNATFPFSSEHRHTQELKLKNWNLANVEWKDF